MKHYKIIITCLSLVFGNCCFAQDVFTNPKKEKFEMDENFWRGKKEIGLNFTPFIHSLVPFNLGKSTNGFSGIRTKWYDKKSNYAFRTNFGLDIGEDEQFFYSSIGYERRRNISGRFTYTSGWDGFGAIFVSDLPTPIIEGISGIGIAKFYGIEYNINKFMFISTEASAMLAVSSDGFLKFNYPTAIFLNIRL